MGVEHRYAGTWPGSSHVSTCPNALKKFRSEWRTECYSPRYAREKVASRDTDAWISEQVIFKTRVCWEYINQRFELSSGPRRNTVREPGPSIRHRRQLFLCPPFSASLSGFAPDAVQVTRAGGEAPCPSRGTGEAVSSHPHFFSVSGILLTNCCARRCLDRCRSDHDGNCIASPGAHMFS
jgi:hypothetical protein